jgi:hypothetical protein
MNDLHLLANVRHSWPDTENKDCTVVDIGHDARRERALREQRERHWQLTDFDLERIAADISKKPIVAEKVKDLKAVASKAQKPSGGKR